MKKLQKGFTLVELIVVITILAILGTIAFISLQGYSQDAKNSKVTSDIRTLVSAVETSLTDGSITLGNLVTGDTSLINGVTGTFASGVTLATNVGSGVTYQVGNINFANLKQNGADFKDSTGNPYVVSVAVAGSENAYYQVVGQTANADGLTNTAVVKGNYIQVATSDATGLVSASGSTTGLANGDNMTSLY